MNATHKDNIKKDDDEKEGVEKNYDKALVENYSIWNLFGNLSLQKLPFRVLNLKIASHLKYVLYKLHDTIIIFTSHYSFIFKRSY